ncbi:ATP phosphoribosyltransferase regulatory subunit, partial [Klebsiella pneumoniae]
DTAAADAEVLGLALEGLARLGRRDSSVRIGDMGLTNALLNALEVPPAAKRRTLRALAAGRPLADLANGAAEE